MNHFFCDYIDGKMGHLSEEDSHHASRVLRLGKGDLISVSSKDGKVFEAHIVGGDKKELAFSLGTLLREEKASTLSVAIAPTKSNDRFEWFLEKATELGIRNIYPILSANSERKVYKVDRGYKIIHAAAKQSKKGFLPHLHEVQKLPDFLKSCSIKKRYVAHLGQGERKELSQISFTEEAVFLIGPEGDFNASEIELCLANSFLPVSLGDEVLRTETAGVKIAAVASLLR